MAVQVKGQPIETKPAAGLSATVVIGYALALVFAIWPNFAARVPDDLKLQLPVVIGAILGAAAAYFAPHTNRPDLPPVVPPDVPVAPVAPPVPVPPVAQP